MSLPWFHVEALPEPGDAVSLDKHEAKHAAGPRRLGPGDEVVLFDGRGHKARGRIGGRDERGGIEVEVEDHEVEAPESPRIALAASLPKGDRLSTMLDMATQLGILAFQPLHCDFSVITLDRKRQDPTDRWNRIMMEACKQSRRAMLPAILPQARPLEVVAEAAARGATVLVGDPQGRPIGELPSLQDVVILVGPEGGFSPSEHRAILDAGAIPARVGLGTLRVETAAAAMVAGCRAAAST